MVDNHLGDRPGEQVAHASYLFGYSCFDRQQDMAAIVTATMRLGPRVEDSTAT